MALLQLVAYGAQDIYLGENTNTIFSNVTYNRYNDFTLTKEETICPIKSRQIISKKINTLLLTHIFIIKNININEPIVIPMLKNIECPITYNDITNDFIECSVCKICYDYSYEEVQEWHYKYNKCSICRSEMNKTIKNIHGYNIILSELKLKRSEYI